MSGALTVPSRLGDYEVRFEEGWAFLDSMAASGTGVCVCDARVWDLYADVLKPRFGDRALRVEALEDRKNLAGAEALLKGLAALGPRKHWRLNVLGGGIVQDLAGFAASVLFRGVDWDFVPTTLLAQADSCIGGKTSLNFGGLKNLLGTFHPPRVVHIHGGFLGTLAPRDLRSGMGEIIKLHLMAPAPPEPEALGRAVQEALRDAGRLDALVRASLRVKLGYLEGDEFDQGRRNLLNYGHCFGHALESATDYRLPHGQAVTVGMAFADWVAVGRGVLDPARRERVERELLLPNLDAPLGPADFGADRLLKAMRSDKKVRGSGLSVVAPGPGGAFAKFDDVTEAEFLAALEATRRRFSPQGGKA